MLRVDDVEAVIVAEKSRRVGGDGGVDEIDEFPALGHVGCEDGGPEVSQSFVIAAGGGGDGAVMPVQMVDAGADAMKRIVPVAVGVNGGHCDVGGMGPFGGGGFAGFEAGDEGVELFLVFEGHLYNFNMIRKSAELTAMDSKLLRLLMKRGRATWAELAGVLKLSAPAVAEKAKKLEERGVIRGYAAIVDAAAVGYGLTAFVSVTLDRPQHRAKFITTLTKMEEVAECHHIAGDFDYLLKVRCRDTADLDDLLSNRLKALPGIVRTRTTIVLGTAKESVSVPLG